MALTKQKSDFLDLLEKSLGIISTAIERAHISRAKYINWYNSDEEFSKKVDSITEKQIDFVESKLLEKINKGDTTAITFYLRTKGKDRGYTEKQVMEDKEVIININSLLPTQTIVETPVIEIPPAEKPMFNKIKERLDADKEDELPLPDLPLYDDEEDIKEEEDNGRNKSKS